MSHTPGPWEIETPDPTSRGHWIHDADFEWIALAVKREQEGRETELDNARLIRSAPELLASILEIRAIISEGAALGFRPLVGDWADRLYASQAKSAAAVEKALGKLG